MLAISAIVLLGLALSLGYGAFLSQRAHGPVWDVLCVAATLAFLGVLVRIVALRVERMVAEESPAPDGPPPLEPAHAQTQASPWRNMSADSPADHPPVAPDAEYLYEERV